MQDNIVLIATEWHRNKWRRDNIHTRYVTERSLHRSLAHRQSLSASPRSEWSQNGASNKIGNRVVVQTRNCNRTIIFLLVMITPSILLLLFLLPCRTTNSRARVSSHRLLYHRTIRITNENNNSSSSTLLSNTTELPSNNCLNRTDDPRKQLLSTTLSAIQPSPVHSQTSQSVCHSLARYQPTRFIIFLLSPRQKDRPKIWWTKRICALQNEQRIVNGGAQMRRPSATVTLGSLLRCRRAPIRIAVCRGIKVYWIIDYNYW